MGKENRVALVVGNGGYLKGALSNPVNDAALITLRLKQRGFTIFGGASTERHSTGLIDGMDVTRAKAFELIQAFIESLGDGTTAVIYYAGHALQIFDKNYLMPVDATLAGDEPTLELVEIKPQIEKAVERVGKAGAVVVFLDACRNNPLSREEMTGILGRAARSAPVEHGQLGPVAATRGGLSTVKMDRNTDAGRTFIGFATAPGDVAYDGDAKNSPFAKALGDQLAIRGLDIKELFKRVQCEVQDAAARMGKHQDPWSETNLDRNLFLYPRNSTPIFALSAGGLLVGLIVSALLFRDGDVPRPPEHGVWFLGVFFGALSAWGTLNWGSKRRGDAAFAFLGPVFGFAVGLAVLLMIPDFDRNFTAKPATPERQLASYVFGVATVIGLVVYMVGLTLVRMKSRRPPPVTRLGAFHRALGWTVPFLVAATLLLIDYLLSYSNPRYTAITLCALMAGILYAASTELGCRPQLAIFSGFGPFTGAVSVGLLMAMLFAVFAYIAGHRTLQTYEVQALMIAFGGIWHMLLGAQLGFCFALYVPDYVRRRP